MVHFLIVQVLAGLMLVAQTDGAAPVVEGGQPAQPVAEGALGGGDAVDPNGVPIPPNGPGGFFEQFFSNPLNLIMLSALLFMFLVLMPQRREMKRQQQLLSELKKNDRVITSGGIHGVVVSANAGEATISIRIDDNTGTRMTINRSAVANVVNGTSGDSSKKTNS